MKVGVIGLGDIAAKAYLPVIGAREDVVLHISTRNSEKLQHIGEAYRIPQEHRYQGLDDLLQAKLDAVFVHAATEAHYDIVRQCLSAGLHVFVDKPVDYALQRTQELFTIASEKQCLLMVGFNRRFAPMYQRLWLEGMPDIAVMQKNRVNLPGEVRTFVLDDFIHVVDTMRVCNPGPWKDLHVQWKHTPDGKLAHVLLQLVGHQNTAIGIMNRDSGMTEETLEWMRNGRKVKVANLRETIEYAGNGETRIHTGDWQSVGEVRGFRAMVEAFFQTVQQMHRDPESIWPDVTAGMEADLATHRICEQIITRIEAGEP